MDCVYPTDVKRYEESRQIGNARFNLKPSRICYCESDADVKALIDEGKPVRVRSGGHHHEGMCSADNVTILDVSRLNTIYINGDLLVVGPGARLGDVYQALWTHRRLLPGGGCGDVCVGGLVQGGGWGLYSRSLGLTCDRLLGFRIVLADGRILDVQKDGPDSDLFWAVAGAGGGNFGVITEFRFRLDTLDSEITSFTVNWYDRALTAAVINDWRSRFPNIGDSRITSFARLTVLAGGASLDAPIVVAGNFRGTRAMLESILPSLLPNTWKKEPFEVVYAPVDKPKAAFTHPAYQPGPPAEALGELAGLAAEKKSDLGSTCDGFPFPHRVSSCYPNDAFNDDSVRRIANYLLDKAKSPIEPTARRYLSLHSLGGAVSKENASSCFAYRKKPFLLQYQAWWANKDQKDVEDRCMKWVVGFRDAMRNDTEGSFINFPDRDLPLSAYYGAVNLTKLKEIKRKYDSNNFFKFEMSIPIS